MKQNPKAYEYDWDGRCRPGGSDPGWETFSVGVFQWIPKAGGKGLKRGPVVGRIRGYSADAEDVYRDADQLCKELDAKWKRVGA